jgi:hypothetical protein
MKRLALAAALLLASIAAALAQSPVSVIGPITPGDCAAFSSNTVVKDGGFPCPGAGGTLVLPNGTTATTQTTGDNTTKVATDAFVQNQIAADLANPTAAVGLTVVNGAALTAMRSDAAPPLSGSVQSALTATINQVLTGTGAFGFAPITNAQLTALINPFTSGLSGTVPASGGGTVNFLRADGTFAAPSSNVPNNALLITSGGTPAACDYRAVSDGAMGSGSTTFTSVTGGFTANDATNHSYIAVAGAGAAGVTLYTTVATFVSSNQVTLTAANASGGAISAKIAEFGTDDTTAINATIVTAAAASLDVYVPGGKSCLASRINLTNISRLRFYGAGLLRSKIFAKQDASYGTATGHLFDLTGSAFVSIEGLQVGAFYVLAVPTTGILMAQVASGASNRNRIVDVYMSGQFSIATFYNYGVPSLYDIRDDDFYNYFPGSGGHATLELTATNHNALTSSFATVTSGTQSTSDIEFTQVEFHKFAGAGASNYCVFLDGAANILFNSGVISGGCTQYVDFLGAVQSISFHNVTMETEGQPVIPTNGYNFEAATTVDSLDEIGSTYILTTACSPSTCAAKFSAAPTSTAVNRFSH